ncbi:hypothetical protein C1H46_041694 [Malus baccata]|uniref:Cytochrome P450 n=1 Tax=Malus baccata TaxID=106549 RepID=A0A540KEW4_MALBA|nr:hypothetical protein C1H46_041694 [Malus baccata]
MLILSSNNIMCRAILGQKFDDEDGSWFGEVAVELMLQVMSFSFGDLFPASRWIDHLRGFIARLKASFSRFDRFYEQLIDEHKTANREGKTSKKDFVDIILQVQNDGALDFEFTKEDLRALLQRLPERFEDSPIDFKGQDFQLILFGSGRRGSRESPLGLFRPNNILYWFDWKFPSTSVVNCPRPWT